MPERQRLIGRIIYPIKRAEAKSPLAPFEGTFRLARPPHRDAAEDAGDAARRAQRKGRFEGFNGSGPIVLDQRDGERPQREGGGVVVAMRDCRMGVAYGRSGNLRVVSAAREQDLVAKREVAMGEAIIGLEREGAFEQRHCDPRLFRHRRVGVGQRAQHQVVGIEIFRPLALDALDLGVPEARLDGTDRAKRDFILQGENIIERTVIALGQTCTPVPASTSCVVMRTRLPALRTEPSST